MTKRIVEWSELLDYHVAHGGKLYLVKWDKDFPDDNGVRPAGPFPSYRMAQFFIKEVLKKELPDVIPRIVPTNKKVI